MYINKADYEYLNYLQNKLSWDCAYYTDACRLEKLVHNLRDQKNKENEYTRKFNAERRKTNKLYGRSKKEIEAYNKAQIKRSKNNENN